MSSLKPLPHRQGLVQRALVVVPAVYREFAINGVCTNTDVGRCLGFAYVQELQDAYQTHAAPLEGECGAVIQPFEGKFRFGVDAVAENYPWAWCLTHADERFSALALASVVGVAFVGVASFVEGELKGRVQGVNIRSFEPRSTFHYADALGSTMSPEDVNKLLKIHADLVLFGKSFTPGHENALLRVLNVHKAYSKTAKSCEKSLGLNALHYFDNNAKLTQKKFHEEVVPNQQYPARHKFKGYKRQKPKTGKPFLTRETVSMDDAFCHPFVPKGSAVGPEPAKEGQRRTWQLEYDYTEKAKLYKRRGYPRELKQYYAGFTTPKKKNRPIMAGVFKPWLYCTLAKSADGRACYKHYGKVVTDYAELRRTITAMFAANRVHLVDVTAQRDAAHIS